MDVAALSMAMSQASLANQVSLAMTKKGMDQMKTAGENMTKALEASVAPNLGGNVDIKL